MSTPSNASNPAAGSTGSPTFIQIPLPPGMTPEQYMTLQGQVVTIAITVACAFAIILWDYLVLLKDEFTLYTASSKAIWKQPGTWAFIILRYSAIAATFSSLWFTSLQTQHCEAAVRLSSYAAVFVVGSAGVIFCYRVMAIWNGNKLVYAIVGFFYVGMLACWIIVATRYDAITGPSTPFASNCQMKPIVSWAPISYASSVLFDAVVLLLTMLKLSSNFGAKRSEVNKQLYKDNLMYFIITTGTNITVLCIQALGPAYTMIKPTAVPFSTVITVAMAQRVYLNLKLLHQRKQQGVSSSIGMQDSFGKPHSAAAFPHIKHDSFASPSLSPSTATLKYSPGAYSPNTPRSPATPSNYGQVKDGVLYYTRETVVSGEV